MRLAHEPSISILVYCPIELLPGDPVNLSVARHHKDGKLTESDYIKDFDGLVDSRRRKTSTVLTDANAFDFSDVCSELLHRFDAQRDLLPELDYAINRACEEEIGEWCHCDK